MKGFPTTGRDNVSPLKTRRACLKPPLDYEDGQNYFFRFPQPGDDESIEGSEVSMVVCKGEASRVESPGGPTNQKINDCSSITDRSNSKSGTKLKEALAGGSGDDCSESFKAGSKSRESLMKIFSSKISDNASPLKSLGYLRKNAKVPHKSSETPDQCPIKITNDHSGLKRTNSAGSDLVFHKPANFIGMNLGFIPNKSSKKSIFRNKNLYGHEYSSILENSQEFAIPVDLQSPMVTPMDTTQELELIPHEYISGSKRSISDQSPTPWGQGGIEIKNKSSKDSNFALNS